MNFTISSLGKATGIVVLVAAPVLAQLSDPWADAVLLFEPGSGQNSGQEPQYFPHNILGPPDSNATELIASTDPAEILSLGLGGRIVLEFTDNLIVDGPGPDFTVFENAFIRQFGPATGLPFAEPARVAVSKDGIRFVAFPFDSTSLSGLAGVTPTRGHADPTNPDSSGGDAFDLAGIGMDSVRFVELIDVTTIIKDNPAHPYWDPTLSGFDLDAVVAVNNVNTVTAVATARQPASVPKQFSMLRVFPNPVQQGRNQTVHLTWSQPRAALTEIALCNVLGQTLWRVSEYFAASRSTSTIILPDLPAGQYFLRLQTDGATRTSRLSIIK